MNIQMNNTPGFGAQQYLIQDTNGKEVFCGYGKAAHFGPFPEYISSFSPGGWYPVSQLAIRRAREIMKKNPNYSFFINGVLRPDYFKN